MKLLVTGCCGFIGSHLCERLLKEGFNNVYLIDNLVRTENLRNVQDNPKIKFLYGDVSTFDFSVIKNVTHFFHLAATRINRCAKFNVALSFSLTLLTTLLEIIH